MEPIVVASNEVGGFEDRHELLQNYLIGRVAKEAREIIMKRLKQIQREHSGIPGKDVYGRLDIQGTRRPDPFVLTGEQLIPELDKINVTGVAVPVGYGPPPAMYPPTPSERWRIIKDIPLVRNGIPQVPIR